MKDAKGHGSNSRGGPAKPIPNSPFHAKSDAELRYIAKDAAEAGRNAQGMGDDRGVNKYADQVADAATVMGYRNRGGLSDHPNDVAARAAVGSSDKSGKVPTHDSMSQPAYTVHVPDAEQRSRDQRADRMLVSNDPFAKSRANSIRKYGAD